MKGRRLLLLLVVLPLPSRGADYAAKCEAGDGVACQLRASTLDQAGQKQEATRLFDRACQLRYPGGCTLLGMRLRAGDGAPKDAAAAAVAFERGCSLDDMSCCQQLGTLYENGEGVPKNAARASELKARYEALKAAVLAEAEVGKRKREATMQKLDAQEAAAVKANPERYRDYESKCRRGYVEACAMATPLYEYTEPARALELLLFACKDKPESCQFILWIQKQVRLGRQALVAEQLGELCKGGTMKACEDLAGLLYSGGDGFVKDHVRAGELYSRVCAAALSDSLRACAMVQVLVKDPKVLAEVTERNKRSIEELKTRQIAEAQESLRMEKVLEPYVVRFVQLEQELLAQEQERNPGDRLAPTDYRSLDPGATSEDQESARAWKRRREPRRQEIRRLVQELDEVMAPAASGAAPQAKARPNEPGPTVGPPRARALASYAQGVEQVAVRDYGSALKSFSACLQLEPTLSVGYVARGSALMGLRRFAEAQVDYQYALRLDPNLASPLYGLAESYRELNLPAEARTYYGRYLASTAPDVRPELQTDSRSKIAQLRGP